MDLPDFDSRAGEDLRAAFAAAPERATLAAIIDWAEARWDPRWLGFCDESIARHFKTDTELLGRWLSHEVAFRRKGQAQLISTVLASYPEAERGHPASWDALARAAYFFDEIEAGDACLSHLSADWPAMPWARAERMAALLRKQDHEAARREYETLCETVPGAFENEEIALQIAAGTGDHAKLVRIFEARPSAQRFGTAHEAVLYFTALDNLGQTQRCAAEAADWLAEHPDAFRVYHILRQAAHRLDIADTLGETMQAPYRLFPDVAEAVEIEALLALDRDDYARARRLLAEMPATCEPRLRLALTIATTEPGAKGAMRAYRAYRQSRVPHPGPEIQIAAYLFNRATRKRDLARALAILETHRARGTASPWFQRLYLGLLIALGRRGEAEAAFVRLPPELRASRVLREAAMHAEQAAGLHEEAKASWAAHTARTHYRALHSHTLRPKPVSLRYRPGEARLLLMACLFNAAEFLPAFLAHYRALGVDHFLVVDNGSTDGGEKLLAEAPDVSLFSQPGSFKEAGHGVRWINDLIEEHARGKWLLFVDMDEHLVFPGLGRGKSLKTLLDYAEARGFECFPSFMLDLFAPRGTKDMSDFAAHCLFDADYISFPSILPPYRTVQGGARARLTGRHFLITKSPLVRVGPGFRYLENNHTHTHLRAADVTTALLHYKFVGRSRERFAEAIERKEHFMGGRFYKDMLARMRGEGLPRSWRTRRYKGDAQLTRLGLLETSPAWEAWPGGGGA